MTEATGAPRDLRVLQRVVMPVDRDLDVLKLYVEGRIARGAEAVEAERAADGPPRAEVAPVPCGDERRGRGRRRVVQDDLSRGRGRDQRKDVLLQRSDRGSLKYPGLVASYTIDVSTHSGRRAIGTYWELGQHGPPATRRGRTCRSTCPSRSGAGTRR